MTKFLADTPGVPPHALTAQPLSVEEIDGHPDAIRIWATIHAIREEAEKIYEEAFDAGAETRCCECDR